MTNCEHPFSLPLMIGVIGICWLFPVNLHAQAESDSLSIPLMGLLRHQILLSGQNRIGTPSPRATVDFFHLPFFCRLEADCERKAGFPIKVRLGEVQAVERKEGKLLRSWETPLINGGKIDP